MPTTNAERRRRYAIKHADRIAKAHREYNQRKKAERQEYSRRYREKNKDQTREAVTRWRKENPETSKKSKRKSTLKRYGLTPEQYDRLLTSQNGGCAICGNTDPGGTSKGTFPVDHDHATGIVRGLLCQRHNMALGLFKDDPKMLRAAADYLERLATTTSLGPAA